MYCLNNKTVRNKVNAKYPVSYLVCGHGSLPPFIQINIRKYNTNSWSYYFYHSALLYANFNCAKFFVRVVLVKGVQNVCFV